MVVSTKLIHAIFTEFSKRQTNLFTFEGVTKSVLSFESRGASENYLQMCVCLE